MRPYEAVSRENFARFLFVAPVARAGPDACDGLGSYLARRRWLKLVVENQQFFAVARRPDGNGRIVARRARRDGVIATGDGRFSRAIEIGEADAREPLHPVDYEDQALEPRRTT